MQRTSTELSFGFTASALASDTSTVKRSSHHKLISKLSTLGGLGKAGRNGEAADVQTCALRILDVTVPHYDLLSWSSTMQKR